MLKKKLLALIVITSFFTSFMIPGASAETEFQAEKFPFKEMQVQVMPEFDYPEDWSRDIPSLLVGQYGTITNKSGQDYDGKIEIPVPAMEKGFEAYLVAEFPEENKPEVQRPYDVDQEKGLITWKPSKPIKNNETYKFVIEYYTKSIEVNDNKSFTYKLEKNADIEQLDVIFYAPMNAKEIKLEPKAQSNSKSEYGEELYFYQYSNVKAGDDLTYSFSYKKEGTESTLEAINKQQPPNDENHTGANSTATDQVVDGGKSDVSRPIIGVGGASIIGIAIIIAGIFVYLGMKANTGSHARMTNSNKQQQVKKPASAKKENKSAHADEKKELRKKLLTGKIDQEMYEEEMKKLI